MHTVTELYRFFKIIESTQIQFNDVKEFIEKADIPTLLDLLNCFEYKYNLEDYKNKLVNWSFLAENLLNKVMKYYESQSKIIKPLNDKLNKFLALKEKEFKSDYSEKREFKYNTYIKKDDTGSFDITINTASIILAGLRSIIITLHGIEKQGLENILDMLDATKVINEYYRSTTINDMIQYLNDMERE